MMLFPILSLASFKLLLSLTISPDLTRFLSTPSFSNTSGRLYPLAYSPASLPEPSSLLSGLFIITTLIPHSLAARSFSSSPPVAPLSFVRITEAQISFISATFISLEKGPCIAIICFPRSPASSHFVILSIFGRTLAYTLVLSEISAMIVLRSLLPVKRRMFPLIFSRFFAALMTESQVTIWILSLTTSALHNITRFRQLLSISLSKPHSLEAVISSIFAPVSLRSLKYIIPVFSHAFLISAETSVAKGCVASTHTVKPSPAIISAISSAFFLPTMTFFSPKESSISLP